METRTSGDISIAALVVRFDAYSAKEVESGITALLDAGCRKLVCDFSRTEYISSAGLRVLLAAAKKLKRLGGGIALCSLKPAVREVFEIAGFTGIFPIFATEAEALKSLA